jgi:hypothetical protein
MSTADLRPRSASEILDLAFQIYRANWAAMAGATALFVFPILILQAIAPENLLGILDHLSNLFFLAASAAVVVIASGAYMGRQVGAIEAVKTAGSRFLSVWGAAIIQGILIVIGLFLLIVPGIIFAAWTFAMQQAVMIEGRTAGDAFERSRGLAAGNLKHIILTGVLAFFVVIVAVFAIMLVIGLTEPSVRAIYLLGNVALIGLNPITASVGTVLYYDLRIRKEAFDVNVAAERLASAAEQPVSGAPAI